MFNFRTATTLFFIILLGLNVLSFLGYGISWTAYAALIAGYLGISVAASFFMSTGFHMKAYCKADTDEKVMAITFDDGPDPLTTPEVLDVLAKYKVRATFFLIGRKIQGNEQLIRRITEEGHLIGMHSFSHGNFFDFYLPKIMRKEFSDTAEAIRRITGKSPRLFRPPYGVINPLVKKALKNTRLHVIGFSNRLYDTVTGSQEKIINRFEKQLSPGDIVVLHDTHPEMPVIIENILKISSGKNYEIRPLDQLLNIDPYEK